MRGCDVHSRAISDGEMGLVFVCGGLYFEGSFCGVEGFGGGEDLVMGDVGVDFGEEVCDEGGLGRGAGGDLLLGLVMLLYGDALADVNDESAADAVEVEDPGGVMSDGRCVGGVYEYAGAVGESEEGEGGILE